MTTPAASRKDKFGKRWYRIPHPETRELLELPSWSALKDLMHAPQLETWKLKKVAHAIAMSPALQMQAADPDTTYAAVEKALDADTEAADVGTYVHRYTEQIDDGTLDRDFVPEAAKGFVEHYEKLKAEWAWEVAEAEVTVFSLTYGYAGTADRFLRFAGLPALLGLPNPDDDVFPVDVKTGKAVRPEVAYQLCAYANGDLIFEAPSKMGLGFSVREAQLEDDIRNGVGFNRINPNRRKWSDDAIKEARAELEAEWLKAYAEHGKFRPMPAGLRRDVGLVIHLHADKADLVPIRLDGFPPALHVVDGLVGLWKHGRRKDVIGEPIVTGSTPVEATPEPVTVEQEIEHETSAIDSLEKSGLLEGAQVADDEADLIVSDEEKAFYIAWLGDIARDRKHLLPALRQGLDEAGLTKKLRQDDWTTGELRRWSQVAIAVERSALR